MIVAPDSNWDIASDILDNQQLAESVYAIGMGAGDIDATCC